MDIRKYIHLVVWYVAIFGLCIGMGTADNAKFSRDTFSSHNDSITQTGISKSSLSTPQTTDTGELNRFLCYHGEEPIPEYKDRCCADEAFRFRSSWQFGGYYLTSFLERMQRWKCNEFTMECKWPSYNFTSFNKVVYDRFCNNSHMQEACQSHVTNVLRRHGYENTTGNWNELIELLEPTDLSEDEYTDPCISIALFDRSTGGVGRFQEVVETYLPFCGLQWHGYDIDISLKKGVSVWTGLTSGCKGVIIFFMTLMAILGFATIAANSVILFIFASNRKLRNSQAIFQMSLAVADLIVGILVWPNMIVMQALIFINSRNMGSTLTEEALTVNGSLVYFPNFGKDNLTRKVPLSNSKQFNHEYKLFLGFVMLMSIIVSVVTLMAASFDRLYAISFPLRHRRANPKRSAFIVCGLVWLVCLAFCVAPFVVPDLEYDRLSSIFVSAAGTYGTTLALSILIGTMVITWVVSTATFEASRRHALRTKEIFATSQTINSDTEKRLAKTLCLMVGVFSCSVLPAIICLVVGFFLIKNSWKDPRNLNLQAMNTYASVEYIAVILLTMNSLWNCFIYSIRNRGFRKATKDILSRNESQSQQQKTNATTRMNFTNATGFTKRVSEI